MQQHFTNKQTNTQFRSSFDYDENMRRALHHTIHRNHVVLPLSVFSRNYSSQGNMRSVASTTRNFPNILSNSAIGHMMITSRECMAFNAQTRMYAKSGRRGGGGGGGGKKGRQSDDNADSGGDGTAITEVDYKEMDSKINRYVDAFKKSMQQLNTGRANPALLENIRIKLPGGDVVTMKSVANIVVKSPRLLSVNVFEQAHVGVIDRAIRDANLDFNPQAKGNILEVPVPKMTKEIREGIVKQAKQLAETTKENLRLVRRDAMNQIKEIRKHVPKDNAFQMEKELQAFIDTWVKKVDELLEAKEKDIMQA